MMSPATKQILSITATAVAGAALTALLLLNIEPSGTQTLWRYSYLKVGVLGAILCGIVYCVGSLASSRLRWINTAVLYGLVANFVLLEVTFRLFPALIPTDLVGLLPAGARAVVADKRGLFTSAMFRGDRLLYSLRGGPHPLKEFPWVAIDSDGFRNPDANRNRVHVVYFGDSIGFARAARKDLGAQFRDRGISTYSLAMGGNGPFQYRDAYRKYVVERGVVHDTVVVLLSIATDFYDARKYVKVARLGGDYRDYLGVLTTIGAEWPDRQPLWTIAIAARLPALLRHKLTGLSILLTRSLGEKVEVKLPYGTYSAAPQFLDMPEVSADGELWRNFTDATDDIARLVERQGARLVLVVMPNPALLYRNYVAGFEPYKRTLEQRYRTIMSLLNGRYAAQGIQIVDLVAHMAEGIGKRPMATGALEDHFNSDGWAHLADALARELGL